MRVLYRAIALGEIISKKKWSSSTPVLATPIQVIQLKQDDIIIVSPPCTTTTQEVDELEELF